MDKKSCAVVLGGYVNAYSIIQELHQEGIKEIALVQHGNHIAGLSNFVLHKFTVSNTASNIHECFNALKKFGYDYLILYPTDDLHLENIFEIYPSISQYTFIPFNHINLKVALDKFVQYEACEKLEIPYPKTKKLKSYDDFIKLEEVTFPILIKPNKREDLNTKVFRSLKLESIGDLHSNKERLVGFMKKGVSFIASELIPGNSNGTIFAYTAYRSPKSNRILNEWTGKKLSQYPDDFGVFASASNDAPAVIKIQGRKLLESMNLHGICEPEFKYDSRDGKYKLMEINLRSMMWHRMGNISGVKLHLTQWQDANDLEIETYNQSETIKHFTYLKYELLNLIFRKKYYSVFKKNLFGGKENHVAVYNKKDIKPFLYNQFETFKILIKRSFKV